MKKKISMCISIGFVALILTMLMFTQFKTVDETDITAIETMRETELRSELASWKEKYAQVQNEITDRDTRISEYKNELDNEEAATQMLEDEVNEAETYLGYTDVQGKGIIVTLSDGELYAVSYSDLLKLVNELNAAGAEAISINDERIIATSEITVISANMILINQSKITGPYIIKAIGDKKYLESALTIKGGYIDTLVADGKNVSYSLEDNVIITSYDGEKLELEYAKEYVEEDG